MQSQARPAGTVGVAEAPALRVNDLASSATLAHAAMIDEVVSAADAVVVAETVAVAEILAVTDALNVLVTRPEEVREGSELGMNGHIGSG